MNEDRPHLPPLSGALAVLLAVPFATAQQTLVVGPGQPFANIQSAIAAAAPGDTVLVTAGTYAELLAVDKGIRLIGQDAQLADFPVLPAVEVHDVPATQTFVMSGFSTTGSSPWSSVDVAVHDCAGPVLLHDLQAPSLTWSVVVTHCRSVHIAGLQYCSIRSVDSDTIVENCTLYEPSFVGAIVDSGVLSLVDCYAAGGIGAPGALVQGGLLVATRSQISASAFTAFPTPAIASTGGAVLLDPSCVLLPGQGTAPVSGATPTIAPFASLITADDGVTLTVEAHGPAGLPFATLFSAPSPALPTPFGVTWLDPGTALVLQFAAFDATTRLANVAVPHPPLPPGTAFAVQSLVFDGGALRLGVPSAIVVP